MIHEKIRPKQSSKGIFASFVCYRMCIASSRALFMWLVGGQNICASFAVPQVPVFRTLALIGGLGKNVSMTIALLLFSVFRT